MWNGRPDPPTPDPNGLEESSPGPQRRWSFHPAATRLALIASCLVGFPGSKTICLVSPPLSYGNAQSAPAGDRPFERCFALGCHRRVPPWEEETTTVSLMSRGVFGGSRTGSTEAPSTSLTTRARSGEVS